MRKNITYIEIATIVLQQAEKPLTYRQIWERAVAMGLDKKRSTLGRNPKITLASRLYAKMELQDSPFSIITRSPITYWLKSREAQQVGV